MPDHDLVAITGPYHLGLEDGTEAVIVLVIPGEIVAAALARLSDLLEPT